VEVGSTFRRDLKLISETRAPFRGVRKFVYTAFIAGAGISTFFTVPRVIVALQGGGGSGPAQHPWQLGDQPGR